MKKVIPCATLLLISAVLLISPTAYGQNSGGQTDQYCPSDFEATVRQGPHTGNATMLGTLTLSGRGANLAGLFKSKEGYTVPVQAKVTGNLVTLIFNLGGGLYVEGSGPANKQFDASAKCFRLTGTGGLNGPDPADAGDWAITNYSTFDPTPYTSNFITHIFRDLQERDPSSTELNSYTTAINSGQKTHEQVSKELQITAEHRGKQVNAVYMNVLGHLPDSTSWQLAKDFLLVDGSVEHLRGTLLSSLESFQASGGNNSAYVIAVYQNLFTANPDNTTLSDLLSRLQNGESRAHLVASLINGDRHKTKIVVNEYLKELGTQPDAVATLSYKNVLNTWNLTTDQKTTLLDKLQQFVRQTVDTDAAALRKASELFDGITANKKQLRVQLNSSKDFITSSFY